jgi:hypothetical protein
VTNVTHVTHVTAVAGVWNFSLQNYASVVANYASVVALADAPPACDAPGRRDTHQAWVLSEKIGQLELPNRLAADSRMRECKPALRRCKSRAWAQWCWRIGYPSSSG